MQSPLPPETLAPSPTETSGAVQPRLHRVTLVTSGAVFEAMASEPLLLSAEAAGLSWPSSCRNGTCRTCMALLVEGQVVHQVEWPGLSAEEKREGWILPCVALPVTDLVMQFPEF